MEGEEEEESVWREVAKAVVGPEKIELKNEEELVGWENVMLAALALPGASGWEERWETTVLHVAAGVGSERVVDWVVERGGIDLEVRDSFGGTPLWNAGAAGCLGMVRKLVESGADVTVRNTRRVSVLSVASWEGHVDVVAYLLGLGVLDVAAESTGMRSSLFRACFRKRTEVVGLLIEAGADLDVEGRDEYGPLFTACQNGYAEIVRMLVDAGAWSGVGKDGGLWVRGMVKAAVGGYVDVVRVLLDAGVEVDGVDRIGDTALCCASRLGRVDVVRVLVGERGADVNKVGQMGGTPLINACMIGKEDSVQLLLEAGADVGIVGRGGETALDVARRMGWDGIVGMLEEWSGGE